MLAEVPTRCSCWAVRDDVGCESEADSQLFGQVGALLSVGNVPEPFLEGIRLGRMTALKKPDGGVRGIVVGDIIRRLVARTIAKQVSKQAEAATAPFTVRPFHQGRM